MTEIYCKSCGNINCDVDHENCNHEWEAKAWYCTKCFIEEEA